VMNAMCLYGTCYCNYWQRTCNDYPYCPDLLSDRMNCGMCRHVCPTGTICAGGNCGCPPFGMSYCYGSTPCPNFMTDSANCGSCGHVCQAGQTCRSGICST
jgi:hypothetical protein